MKRHPRLIGLSREHHTALKLARSLRVTPGAHALPADAACEVRALRGELERHFDEEEVTLLPILRMCDPDSAARLMREHAELRTLLALNDDAGALARLGTLLEAHVRFEERKMFPAIEAFWARTDPGTERPRLGPDAADKPSEKPGRHLLAASSV